LWFVAALLLAACGRTPEAELQPSTPTPRPTAGEPRAFRIGFSALPATLTDEGYQAAFDLAAEHGDVLLIQRAPAWTEFMGGATPSARTRAQTVSERDNARARGLQLFMALDPFDPAARGRPERRRAASSATSAMQSCAAPSWRRRSTSR
jgi:hypothetical protein